MQLAHDDDDEIRATFNSAQWLSGLRKMLAWFGLLKSPPVKRRAFDASPDDKASLPGNRCRPPLPRWSAAASRSARSGCLWPS